MSHLLSRTNLFRGLLLSAVGLAWMIHSVSGEDPVVAKLELLLRTDEQLGRAQDEIILRYEGATDEQLRDALRDFREKNSALFEAQGKLARELFPPDQSGAVITIEIPAGASAKERTLISEQVSLENEMDEVASRFTDPEKQRDALRNWQERNASRFAVQEQRWKDWEAAQPALPTPPVPQTEIPVNTSPQLRDFLEKEAAFGDEERAVQNSFQSASPEAQRDKMREWRDRNAARIEAQLQKVEQLFN
jgi:hypothetical protein